MLWTREDLRLRPAFDHGRSTTACGMMGEDGADDQETQSNEDRRRTKSARRRRHDLFAAVSSVRSWWCLVVSRQLYYLLHTTHSKTDWEGERGETPLLDEQMAWTGVMTSLWPFVPKEDITLCDDPWGLCLAKTFFNSSILSKYMMKDYNHAKSLLKSDQYFW